MPIRMDAYLGYRPFGARVKVTGKPGAVTTRRAGAGRAPARAGWVLPGRRYPGGLGAGRGRAGAGQRVSAA